MFEIKAVTYEEARREYLEEQMQKAQRSMKYWGSRIDRSRPSNWMDIGHINASDAGWKYNFYKDALEALENNKFQYETGFVKGFEAARPKWISVEERLPGVSDLVLVIANGKPYATVELHNAVLIASYWGDEGWIADGFDGWDKLDVTHYMPLPEPPKEEA